eukprot:5956872-Prymnesium_polylepis.3
MALLTLSTTSRAPSVYIFGGTNGLRAYDDLWAFTPITGWEEITPSGWSAPNPRWNHAAVVWDLAHEGHVMAIMGGQSDNILNTDLHTYSPASNSWSRHLTVGSPNCGLTAHAAVQVRKRIYMVGGIVRVHAGNPYIAAGILVHNVDEALATPGLASPATATTLELSWRLSSSYAQSLNSSSVCSTAVISEYELQLIQGTGLHTTLYRGYRTSFT